MRPVEFYEYIARVAQEKFRCNSDISLAEKIERTLDLILPKFGLERSRVEPEICSVDSMSIDDSVDIEDLDLS